MGDISELRGLIVVVSFLGISFLMIAWIPANFYSAPDAREIDTPEVFESIDVWSFAETFTLRMNETGGYVTYGNMYSIANTGLDIGNRDFTFTYRQANQTPLDCFMKVNWYWFIFPQSEALDWRNREGVSRGTTVTVEEMEADAELPDNSTVSYNVFSKQWNFQYVGSFSYDPDQYSNFTHAWNYHQLYFFWGVNFDQINTSYNVAGLIFLILFFQLPEGIPFQINAIIAIPFWVCIAYLIYVLIIKVIPFIAGG